MKYIIIHLPSPIGKSSNILWNCWNWRCAIGNRRGVRSYTRVTRGEGGVKSVHPWIHYRERKRDSHAELLSRDHLNASHSKTLSPFFFFFYNFLFVPLHSHRNSEMYFCFTKGKLFKCWGVGVTPLSVKEVMLVRVTTNSIPPPPPLFFCVLNSILWKAERYRGFQYAHTGISYRELAQCL